MFKSLTPNLMVDNVEETIHFYEEKLGFAAVATVPATMTEYGALQFAILVKDGLTVMVQEKHNLAAEYPTLQTENLQPSISLYIPVDDIDALYRDLQSTCEISAQMHKTFYAEKEFAILDNNGYVLTFAESKE